jgi:hypothetical protein
MMPFSVTIHGNADRINRILVGTRSKKTSTALSLKPIFTGSEGPTALNWPAEVFSSDLAAVAAQAIGKQKTATRQNHSAYHFNLDLFILHLLIYITFQQC